MTVHALPTPLSDIPAMLRKLADAIEANQYGHCPGVVVVLEAAQLPVLGYGSADPTNASELLACAHLQLVSMRKNHLESLIP